MALFGYFPVKAGATISDPAGDKRHARVIEQYYLGEEAIYLPGRGLSWRYLPYREIRGVIPGYEKLREDTPLVKYERDKPMLRLIYQGGDPEEELMFMKNMFLREYVRTFSLEG